MSLDEYKEQLKERIKLLSSGRVPTDAILKLKRVLKELDEIDWMQL